VTDLLAKIVAHAREGTLLAALLRKIGVGSRRSRAQPDHYHGDVARDYIKKRTGQKHWHVEQQIVEELLADIGDGAVVLDVPFGTGRFVKMYLRKEMSVYGVDISRDMLLVAREDLGPAFDECSVQIASADSLPYRGGCFDLVVCFRFFGLISFDMARRVLSEFRRVCRGVVIIRIPILRDTATRRSYPGPEESLQGRMYDRELAELFAAHDFEVADRRLIAEKNDNVLYYIYVLRKRPAAGDD
jgi:ubiquinone/menaquinone biosynthesis C-methylase UbiE